MCHILLLTFTLCVSHFTNVLLLTFTLCVSHFRADASLHQGCLIISFESSNQAPVYEYLYLSELTYQLVASICEVSHDWCTTASLATLRCSDDDDELMLNVLRCHLTY